MLIFKGVKISLPKDKIPIDFVMPEFTEAGGEWQQINKVFEIEKSIFEADTQAQGLTNLVNKIAEIVQDYINANLRTDIASFESHVDFKNFETNQVTTKGLYTNESYLFICNIIIYTSKND